MRFFENGQSRLYKINFLLQTKILKASIRPKPSILLGSVRYSEIEREYLWHLHDKYKLTGETHKKAPARKRPEDALSSAGTA